MFAVYAREANYNDPLASVMVDAAGHPASVVVECTGSSGNVLTLQRDVNGAVDGVSSLALTSPACDVAEWHTFYPFSWSASEGAVIGAAIVGVWSIAWAWRSFGQALKGKVSSSGDGEE